MQIMLAPTPMLVVIRPPPPPSAATPRGTPGGVRKEMGESEMRISTPHFLKENIKLFSSIQLKTYACVPYVKLKITKLRSPSIMFMNGGAEGLYRSFLRLGNGPPHWDGVLEGRFEAPRMGSEWVKDGSLRITPLS
jgi:hypothetical protein